MATDAEKRILINTTAMAEVNAGGHYLKGGDGAIPGHYGSGLFRQVEVVEYCELETVSVHAAKNSFGVCRGRWGLMTLGKKFLKGDGGDRDVLLPKYLAELKASILPKYFWWDFENRGLYPRVSSGYIYLGEDCRGKRHFDCEGFVAWVLVKALGKDKGTWRKGVSWYQDGGGGRLKIYKAVGNSYKADDGDVITTSEIRDGDILIRKPNSEGGEHIALACAGGTGVLEASSKNKGVQHSNYTANWTELARIKSL